MLTIPNFCQIEKPNPRKGYNPNLLHPPAIIFEPIEPGITANGQVLLQVGYFITSSPEPLPN